MTLPLCESCHGKVHDADMNISALIKLGHVRARAAGVRIGRPPEYAHRVEEILLLFSQGISKNEIARRLKMCRVTVQNIIKNKA